MKQYTFTVVVLADDQVQASTVLWSRIGYNEDMTEDGVRDYTIYSPNVFAPNEEVLPC